MDHSSGGRGVVHILHEVGLHGFSLASLVLGDTTRNIVAAFCRAFACMQRRKEAFLEVNMAGVRKGL